MYRQAIIFFVGFLFLALRGLAQAPVADFKADILQGCSPVVVTFTDLSTNDPSSWQWDMGNGSTPTRQNPSAIYITPGKYTVKLTATNRSGSGTITKVAYITVFDIPKVNISSSPSGGCAPLVVSFKDLSSGTSAPITSWVWDFGDGNTSFQQNPTNTYKKSGNYNVHLIVTDANGCKEDSIFKSAIQISPQVNALFSASPTASCNNQMTVNFSDLSSGGTGMFTYLWDFGDGSVVSTASAPSHTYLRASGTSFNVKLIVKDNTGCTDSILQNNLINFIDFKTDFSSSINGKACVPATVQFTDQSVAAADSWLWDFGDGVGTSTQQNPSYTYTTAGTFNVKLVSKKGSTCIDSVTKLGLLNLKPSPVADFIADTSKSCEAPFTVNFTDKSVNAISWLWDFGDGSPTSSLPSASHTYTNTGMYTVSLKVNNTDSCFDTKISTNLIQIIPPKVDFIASPSSGCVPLTVQFTDQTFSNETINNYSWDFGDGSPIDPSPNPSHTYNNTGTYNVKLLIKNNKGCTDSLTKNTFIKVGTKPVAQFTSNTSIACVNSPIQFTDNSTNANAWTWSFGDGDQSASKDPLHAYRDTGTYTVTLVAINGGCSDAITQTVKIIVPKSQFSYLQDCSNPFHIDMVDQSEGADLNSYQWDFGDGNTSTLINPSHDYVVKGIYNARLVVSNASTSCSDTSISKVTVGLKGADFLSGKTTGCPPFDVKFWDISSDADFWSWDLGDGSVSTDSTFVHTYMQKGSYDVRLIITNPTGCNDTILKKNYVVVDGPSPNFAADTTTGCAPLTVQFNDFSISSKTLIKYIWDYGDGFTDTFNNILVNPIHTFKSPGNYSVSLTVMDTDSCSITYTRSSYIQPTFPQPAFSSNKIFICQTESVHFNNLSTGTGLKYMWNFGDGDTSTQVNPDHIYSKEGIYTIKLKATDINGCDSTLTIPNYLTLKKPKAGFYHSPKIPDCAPFAVTFTDTSFNGNIVGWDWDFGDSVTSNLQNPSHIYSIPGTYDIQLIVTTADGCRDTVLQKKLITVLGPYGTLKFSPNRGCIGTSVTFIVKATNTVSYTYDYRDGEVDKINLDSIVHVYNRAGVFYPILLLEDGTGCKYPMKSTDSIVIDTIPVVDFSSDNGFFCKTGLVQFHDLSISTRAVKRRHWDFGDGDTSNLKDPTHFYKNKGEYDVSLSVENILGCSDTLIKLKFIQVVNNTEAAFNIPDSNSCTPYLISPANVSTSTDGIASYRWDFGDGTTDTSTNPLHTYSTSGTFNLMLIVQDRKGCSDTSIKRIDVYDHPQAGFEVIHDNSDGSCNEISVNFTDQSLGTSSMIYDFGDGTQSSDPNPFHQYPASGQYKVLQKVFNTHGCEDTISKDICVYVSATLLVPNAFSPNNDPDKRNEFFVPLSFAVDTYNMKIYDRWGKKVFESFDSNNNWDGTMNGQSCIEGIYVYILSGRGRDGNRYKFYGTVALTR